MDVLLGERTDPAHTEEGFGGKIGAVGEVEDGFLWLLFFQSRLYWHCATTHCGVVACFVHCCDALVARVCNRVDEGDERWD